MKRIFKQASVALLGLTAFTAIADEGEIYLADLGNNKPQVLIILDTSAHMKEEADYPYPKYYDPHIAYPPIPDTKAENLVYKYLYGGEDFYYNRSSTAKALVHSDLQAIAEKAVNTFSGGPALTSAEQTKYDQFVTTIPALGSSSKIDYSSMNCNSALPDFQGDLGAYQDNIGQWLVDHWLLFFPFYNWASIGSQNTELVRHFVDCQLDITKNDPFNPGYEHNALVKADDDNDDGYDEKKSRQGIPSAEAGYPGHVYWNSYISASSAIATSSAAATFSDKAYLYSDNLVKWKALKDDDSDIIQLSNLQIAKKVVLDLMLDTTEISTGLEIFNPNNTILEKIDVMDNHGGRVISGISSYDPEDYETEADYKAKVSLLKSKVKDVLTTNLSKSALCESLYEGYRYLYGEGVYFGDDQKLGAKPKRDLNIEAGGNYISPLDWVNTCQTEAYIIMVTTGHHDVSSRATDIVKCGGIFGDLIRIDAHDHDSEANELIEDLDGVTAQDIKDKAVQVNNADTTCDKNLLPVLSDWLANNDIDETTDVKERIVTYTVGIGELDTGRRNLLEKTAEYGDGEFYNALNANELRQKLEMAFADIIARQKGVTAAVGTSINSSNSTKSNEFVYYTMFQPNQTSKWKGNIRKLKVTDEGQLSAWTQSASAASSLGSATSAALSTSDSSFFNDDLYSAWSSEQGLNDVELGGVVEALRNRQSARNIYISNADDSALLPLTKANLLQALAVTTDADLANALGVSEATLVAAIDWLQGKDEAGEFRDDIFGDPMHAQPLVVEYLEGTETKARIFIGTNAGFFHAFKDNGRQVEEEWAFIPKENLATALKLNLQVTRAEERIYGIDSSAVDAEYLGDDDKPKHIITFGLRRGGSKYFSLNVNLDPDEESTTKPELNWVLDAEKMGFSALAQTWSTPVVSKVFRGDNSTNDKPVLIFGGGYDEAKDDCGSNSTTALVKACTDTSGKAVYIIDADDGSKLKAFEHGVITDSIASELAVMDSDGDGYVDRIYAPDTGGNIYRIDMPKIFDVDESKFTMDTNKWRIFKLASLGGTTADDRRFFSAPSIVRAREGASSYDGLLLGSGDITSPNSNITAQNYFFNIKDTNIYPQVWGSDEGEREAPATITLSNLEKISYNSTTDSDVVQAIDYDTDTLHGWHYTLNEATVTNEGVTTLGGEKSLGNAVVINGIVHFNTYSPFAIDYVIEDGQCVMNQSGNSHYYQVALNSGSTKYYQKLPNVIAKDLAVHAASTGNASVLRLLGAGKGDITDDKGDPITPTGTIDTEVTLSPRPIYRYFNEAVQ